MRVKVAEIVAVVVLITICVTVDVMDDLGVGTVDVRVGNGVMVAVNSGKLVLGSGDKDGGTIASGVSVEEIDMELTTTVGDSTLFVPIGLVICLRLMLSTK